MPETLQMVLDSVAPKSNRWREGPRISAADLKNNTGAVDLLTPGLEGKPVNPTSVNIPPLPGRARAGEAVMTFGKFKGKSMEWVKENESGYWSWCLENLGWFAAKVEKSGLLL